MRLVTKAEVNQRMERNGIPAGFSHINASVYVNPATGAVVITGDPIDDGAEESAHNCDVMGCRWEHIVLRTVAAKPYERMNLRAFVVPEAEDE